MCARYIYGRWSLLSTVEYCFGFLAGGFVRVDATYRLPDRQLRVTYVTAG